MADGPELSHQYGTAPVPDPTTLTNELVAKAIVALRELIEARLHCSDVLVDQLRDDIKERPHAIEAEIRHIQALHDERFKTMDEKFSGVQTQFLERDVRVRESAAAATTAINAALQSQKEAAGEQAKSFATSVDKTERATLEQIAQQRVLLDSATKAISDKIDDVKERITRIESVAVGTVTAKTEAVQAHTSNAQTVAMAAAAGGLVVVVIELILRFAR